MPLTPQQFYLIRHGQTEMNAAELSCGGGVDTNLTETGRDQARQAAKVLAALPLEYRPTRIVHSNMNRTRDTAEILNFHLDLPMTAEIELREHMLGEWEGKAWKDTLPLIRADQKPENGESATEYAQRVREALRGVFQAFPNERLLIVAHGGTFHSILRLYKLAERKQFIENCRLHDWQPEAKHQDMPWQIDQIYQDDHAKLERRIADICPRKFV